MNAIEKYKKEDQRLQLELKTDYVSSQQWRDNCRFGYGVNSIRKDLKMTYTEMAEEVRKKKLTGEKVFCKRGEGAMIRFDTQCIPGGGACFTCPHPNEKNRMSHTLTKEEEDEFKYTPRTGGGYSAFHNSLK